MKQYFHAAKSWDRQRRFRLREEPNDPEQNRIILNQLVLMALRANPGDLVDGPQEDEAESRLARILSGRPPHPRNR